MGARLAVVHQKGTDDERKPADEEYSGHNYQRADRFALSARLLVTSGHFWSPNFGGDSDVRDDDDNERQTYAENGGHGDGPRAGPREEEKSRGQGVEPRETGHERRFARSMLTLARFDMDAVLQVMSRSIQAMSKLLGIPGNPVTV